MSSEDERDATLGDYVTLQRGATYQGKLLGQPGPVLLGLASIQRDGGFREDSLRTYGGASADKLILRPGDLYVSLKDVTQSGDLLGAVSRVPLAVAAGRLTQDTVRLDLSTDAPPRAYLYWLLRTPQYRGHCRARAIGTTNLSLSRDDFLAFPVPPPTAVGLRLVSLLEAIEAKIELNRRMNRTLESIARAIFKSWFVDFDPVRKQMEGGEVGLPSELAACFPNSFGSSVLGPVPSGWKVSEIGREVHVVGGSTPQTGAPEYWNGDIDFATPKDLAGLLSPVLLRTARKVTLEGAATISSGVLNSGTVLMSSRAPIGYLAINESPVCVNQGFIAMRCDGSLPRQFVLNWARSNMDAIVGNANGTTFLEISKRNFRPLPVVVPPPPLLERFASIADALHGRIVAVERENGILAAVRDALLPKLLSGEFAVSGVNDAVSVLEEAAQ